MTLVSILYVILSILGLSFLIFIHELGHYYMARRVGMRVETFSIGIGKPIYYWMRDGVKWQIGWLLFGGYVKIAGTDAADKDPHDVKDGFFGKSPWDRIKVAFMGPLVNIVFAFLAFTALWLINGRNKDFHEYTHKIGWVDPKSALYLEGNVRPGDEVVSYHGQPYQSAKDHFMAPMTADGDLVVTINRVNFHTQERKPETLTVKPYINPHLLNKDILTSGILSPASYLIYNRLPNGKDNPLPEGSPMKDSGILAGDRIVWMDGEPIYSLAQLTHVLNDGKALLTISRGQETLLRRVPRVMAEELKLDAEFKEELIDWQFEAELNTIKIQKLYTIPYNLNNECKVESRVKFIDKDNEEEAFPKEPYSILEMPLEEGDKILAVDGIPVSYSFQVLSHLQQRHVNIIVERDPKLAEIPTWQQSDKLFDEQYQWNDLQKLVSQIGLSKAPQSAGNLYLLGTVVPKTHYEFRQSPESQALFAEDLKKIEKIEDPEKRAQALTQLAALDQQLLLGLPVQDARVQYNPNPLVLFEKVFDEIWFTLKALFSGSLNPKWMSGPIGIVQVVHDTSMVSIKEALYWLGAISLNLGVLNLLPFPVLDGGTICFSLYELVTGKRIKTKTLEKLIIPFAILLIGLFIFLTFHDLARIFHWPF